MKANFVVCCFVVSLFPSFASGQKDSSKTKLSKYIAVNGGLSIPVVPFVQPASIPFTGNVGYNLGISVVFPIKKPYLSGIIECSYGANTYHESNDPYSQQGNYVAKSLLGGIIFSDPTNNKTVFVDFRILAGALLFSNPEESDTSEGGPGNPNSVIDIKSATITAFACDVGIGFKKLTKRSMFSLNIDVMFSGKESCINTISEGVYEYANRTTQVVSMQQAVTSLNVFLLNVTLGYGFKIGR